MPCTNETFLNKTVHAGEGYGPESIFQALQDCHADRIGHGFHLFSTDRVTDPRYGTTLSTVCPELFALLLLKKSFAFEKNVCPWIN